MSTQHRKEQSSGTAPVRILLALFCVLILTALTDGCARSKPPEEHVGPPPFIPAPTVPAFLSGPAALLLTNVNGFEAHATLETMAEGSQRSITSGVLMGREGKLFFAPDSNSSTGKQPSHAEDNSFIWNVADSSGYVLNGPMQSYAPVSSSRAYTNIIAARVGAGSSEITIQSSDGTTATLQVQQSGDVKGLPTRITGGKNGAPMVLTISKVQFKLPPEDVFAPPADFTKYPSAEAMMNELSSREQSLKHKRGWEPPPSDQIGLPPSGGGPTTTPPR